MMTLLVNIDEIMISTSDDWNHSRKFPTWNASKSFSHWPMVIRTRCPRPPRPGKCWNEWTVDESSRCASCLDGCLKNTPGIDMSNQPWLGVWDVFFCWNRLKCQAFHGNRTSPERLSNWWAEASWNEQIQRLCDCFWSLQVDRKATWQSLNKPICSMYGIFTYICPNNHPNVGKYTLHGAYGKWYNQ